MRRLRALFPPSGREMSDSEEETDFKLLLEECWNKSHSECPAVLRRPTSIPGTRPFVYCDCDCHPDEHHQEVEQYYRTTLPRIRHGGGSEAVMQQATFSSDIEGTVF